MQSADHADCHNFVVSITEQRQAEGFCWVKGVNGALNYVVFKTKIFTLFDALMPSFYLSIISVTISLQLHKNNNRIFITVYYISFYVG